MKIKYLCALLLAALIYSCDDSTTGIGTDLIPGGDKIPANTDSYEFTPNLCWPTPFMHVPVLHI